MRLETLRKAIIVASNFIYTARQVRIIDAKYSNGKPYKHLEEYTKESATCKRASMDLTRVLSDLRQGR